MPSHRISGWSRHQGAALSIALVLLSGCGGSVIAPGEAAGTTSGVGGAASTSGGMGGSFEGGCPPDFPTATSPCQEIGLECTYKDGASGSAGCPSRWVCSQNPVLGGLTWGLLQPNLGTSCAEVGLICWYWSCLHPPASTSTNVTVRCDASLTWTVEQSSLPTDVACDFCDHAFEDGEPCDLGRDYALCSTVVGLVCGHALYDIACIPDPGGGGRIKTSFPPCP